VFATGRSEELPPSTFLPEDGNRSLLCKGKGVPVHAMKAYRGGETYFYSFLISAPDGCERSTSPSGRFTPTEEQSTHCTGCWVGTRVDLVPLPGFEHRTVQSVAWPLYRQRYSGSFHLFVITLKP
jgi:hypothetical protein